MNYDEKKAIVIQSILEAEKLKLEGQNARLFTERTPLKDLEEGEIRSIIQQFQQLNKLQVVSINIGQPSPLLKGAIDVIGKPENYIEINNIDSLYFKEGHTYTKHHLEHSLSSNNNFFIEFNDDRRIMLNGKIDLAKPDFAGENEAIFIFLYKNPNRSFSKKEIEDATNVKVAKSFDKIVENLGFRRGLKTAFFDINKTTIKFKNPITL